MPGETVTRDAPAATTTTIPAPPLSPFVALAQRDDALRLIGRGVNTIGQQRQMAAGHSLTTRFGAPVSVISGGVACVLTVLLIGWKAPAIRGYRIDR